MLSLKFISDPGHGWLEIPMQYFKELNITISKYSYYSEKRNMIYAEEDCDAPKVINALNLYNIKFNITNVYLDTNNCYIRRCIPIQEGLDINNYVYNLSN